MSNEQRLEDIEHQIIVLQDDVERLEIWCKDIQETVEQKNKKLYLEIAELRDCITNISGILSKSAPLDHLIAVLEYLNYEVTKQGNGG